MSHKTIRNCRIDIFHQTRIQPSIPKTGIERVDFMNDLPVFHYRATRLVCIEWVSEDWNRELKSHRFILNSCNYKIINILGGNLFAAYSQ